MSERTLSEKRAQRLGLELRAVVESYEEPASTHDGVERHGPEEGEVLTSIAISLKRIADALTSVTSLSGDFGVTTKHIRVRSA